VSLFYEISQLWRIRKWLRKGGVARLNTEKLKSRKLWMTIIGSIVLTVMSAMEAPPDIINTLKWVLITYVGVQGAVDLTAKRNGQ
jgi:hypothetical protein